MSYAQASTFPLTFTTAVIPLLPAHPIGAGLNPTFDSQVSFAGEPALVIGGSTSVGQFGVSVRYLVYYISPTFPSYPNFQIREI